MGPPLSEQLIRVTALAPILLRMPREVHSLHVVLAVPQSRFEGCLTAHEHRGTLVCELGLPGSPGHSPGGPQGTKVQGPNERVGPVNRNVIRVRLFTFEHARTLRIVHAPDMIQGCLDRWPQASQPGVVAAGTILAISF